MKQPMLPKEHGAYAILLVPFLIGAKIGGGFDVKIWLYLLSVVAIFFAYYPFVMIARVKFAGLPGDSKALQAVQWFVLYVICSMLLSGSVIISYQLFWLLLFGAITLLFYGLQLFFVKKKWDKTLMGNLLAVVALTSTAPSAYYVASGNLNMTAVTLWVLNILFFGSGIVYVRMKIESLASKHLSKDASWSSKLLIGRFNLIYHILIFVALGVMVWSEAIPALVVIAFIPVTIHSIIGMLVLRETVNFKVIGWTQVGYALVFGVILVFAVN